MFKLKWHKFRSIKRGYYSFCIIIILYLLSFILPFFVGSDAIVIKYSNSFYFPIFKKYSAETFGQNKIGEPNYRTLKKQFEGTGNWVILPLYHFGPYGNILEELGGYPPHPPTNQNFMGTDDRGRDTFSRIAYGFNISLSFALIVTLISYIAGITLGAIIGYFGGILDFFGQRTIEIWQTLPFIYIIMIISSLLIPGFWSLVIIVSLFGWMGITYYVRGEVYREKSLEYVIAAKSIGIPAYRIILKHIIPNCLNPIISFAPFAIVGNIAALVSLDFLGLGIPQPIPSWGQLMNQGVINFQHWWLLVFPLIEEFITLLLIVFIGEAVREAFDPKKYSKTD